MGGKAKRLINVSDEELLGELVRRDYFITNPDRKKDREMAVDLISLKTGDSRPMRKLSLLCPKTSPLWWKD